MPDEIELRERRRWDAADPTWALWDVMRAATDAGYVLAERVGLPYNDMRALDVLTQAEEALGPVELGHRLGMRSASATELVDRLAAGGHVRRVRHPRDRRRVVIEVTETGWHAVMTELGPLLERFDRVAAELGPQGSAAVVAYLRAIAAEQRAYCEGEPENGTGSGRRPPTST